jgi:DNA (cytosine-5)-methyltransferase 1
MSRNRRRDWHDVSFTIPAMAKQVALHPSSPAMHKIGTDLWESGQGNTRRFSWREAAVIQTFPQELEFVGDLTSKYRQIGNAVPVKLGQTVAESVKLALNSVLYQTS